MILAVDNGLENLGWAIVVPSTGDVVALGVVHQKRDQELDESVCRAMRVWEQAGRLTALARVYGCTRLVGESMSFGGPPNARFAMAISLGLSWGAAAAIAAALRLDLAEIHAKVWQREVDPDAGAKVDYDRVFSRLSDYVTGGAAGDLHRIPARLRNHALDAVGIGVVAALRPHLLAPIAGAADLAAFNELIAFHEERARART